MVKRVIFVLFILLFQLVVAQSISQFRGPNRDGHYPATNLLKEWPEQGPEILWKAEDLGDSYAAVSVYDGIVYTTGKIDQSDYLTAVDPNGKQLWQTRFGDTWTKSFAATRSIPTVEGDFVYVNSGMGEVVCIERHQGKIVWARDVFGEYEGKYESWGGAESPLIVDDLVISTPGGLKTTMVALDKKTGKTVWATESLGDTTAYVSPILIRDKGLNQIVGVTSHHIFGVNPQNGNILWKEKYSDIQKPTWHANAPVINCTSPLYYNKMIYVTSGYNHAGVMLKLENQGTSVQQIWVDTTLDNHIGGVVLVNGYIYGSNWIDNRNGNWCCIDWASGKTMYETEWNNKGSIIYADGMLYCYEEKRGNVGIVKATPEGFNMISSFRVLDGKGPHWAMPVVDDGVLYIRHGDVLIAYDIKS